MADRCIRLTRIHAIQWFGYCDTFDIHGNLLIAGRTGAGKSVLMDLLQLVLIGDQRARYNAASDARGNTSGRDKKSYCLCDTQEDINGVAQYARDGGTTYIALEFTWPDGKKTETWGMRIEYASRETQTPEEEFFMVADRLDRSDFITPEGFALDLDGYRLLLKNKDGDSFRNVTEYRKRLAEHLNFHRETIDYLMPSAMSFSFLPRFDEFCRHYILQAEDIKIEPVQQSYRSYLRIREELDKLHDKIQRLTSATMAYQDYVDTVRDATVCQFLAAEFGRIASQRAVQELNNKISEISQRQARLREEADALKVELETKEQNLDSLQNIFRDKGGGVLLEINDQLKRVVHEIGLLQELGKNLDEEKERRVRRTKDFLQQAEAFLKERKGGSLSELTYALRQFEEARPDGLKVALQQLSATIQSTVIKVRSVVSAESEETQHLRDELQSLQSQLTNLDRNRVEDSPLLDELNRRLPRQGRTNPARQLRELCEVKDEAWRPAIELAFTRKFAIVVPLDQHAEALRIYREEFDRDSLKESLVDPERALARQSSIHPESLATKLECQDPIAHAVVNELFGQVICVNSVAELRQHQDAILSDGFRMRGLFAERPKRYDQRPCIGAKGVERLKAYLKNKADECGLRIRGLQPVLARAEQIQTLVTDHRLNSNDIEADIRAAKDLKDAETKRDRLITLKSEKSTPELEKQVETINSKKAEIAAMRERQLELAGRLQTQELAELQKRLKDATNYAEKAESHYQQVLAQTGAILSIARCEELRTYYKQTYPTEEAQEAKVRQQLLILEAQAPSKLAHLKLIRQGLVDQHADLRTEPDFDPETLWNASYAKLLERIRVEDMPARQQQAREEEQRWQELFRTTVASRLSNAIRDVRDTINNINLPLKKPIGDSQYHIQVEENTAKEFQEYRRVLDACAITQDGQSIFASLEGDARAGVERVFNALVNESDGKLAKAFLDYRSYYRYDMLVSDPKRPELPAKSLNRHSDKFSGGEKQTPFYISILACYLRAYHRHIGERYIGPSLGLVPIDEAFSKMSGERITDAIRALRDVELQGILSMSSGNWPYAISECDQVLAIHQKEQFVDGHKSIRNIGALLNRAEALERSKGWE